MVVTRSGRGWEKWTDIGQRVQTSSYKMNKIWEPNVHRGDYSSQYCITYLEVVNTVNLTCSHHTHTHTTHSHTVVIMRVIEE